MEAEVQRKRSPIFTKNFIATTAIHGLFADAWQNTAEDFLAALNVKNRFATCWFGLFPKVGSK